MNMSFSERYDNHTSIVTKSIDRNNPKSRIDNRYVESIAKKTIFK